jgi:hypothetical protein
VLADRARSTRRKSNYNQIVSAHKKVYAPFKSDELQADVYRVFKEKPPLAPNCRPPHQELVGQCDCAAYSVGRQSSIVKSNRLAFSGNSSIWKNFRHSRSKRAS